MIDGDNIEKRRRQIRTVGMEGDKYYYELMQALVARKQHVRPSARLPVGPDRATPANTQRVDTW
jgi:hypothetical protein